MMLRRVLEGSTLGRRILIEEATLFLKQVGKATVSYTPWVPPWMRSSPR